MQLAISYLATYGEGVEYVSAPAPAAAPQTAVWRRDLGILPPGTQQLGMTEDAIYSRDWSVYAEPVFKVPLYEGEPVELPLTLSKIVQAHMVLPLDGGDIIIAGSSGVVRVGADNVPLWYSEYDDADGAKPLRTNPIGLAVKGSVLYVVYKWNSDVYVFSMPLESPPALWPPKATWAYVPGAMTPAGDYYYWGLGGAVALASVVQGVEYGTFSDTDRGADGAMPPSIICQLVDTYTDGSRYFARLYGLDQLTGTFEVTVSSTVDGTGLPSYVETSIPWEPELPNPPPTFEGLPLDQFYPQGVIWMQEGETPPPPKFWTNRVFTEEVV